ncbi:MAG TPA: hypothetical protein VHZ03_15225 [Trebonia sp.]|nr:hypothetical protein [Trebonia sp.]
MPRKAANAKHARVQPTKTGGYSANCGSVSRVLLPALLSSTTATTVRMPAAAARPAWC